MSNLNEHSSTFATWLEGLEEGRRPDWAESFATNQTLTLPEEEELERSINGALYAQEQSVADDDTIELGAAKIFEEAAGWSSDEGRYRFRSRLGEGSAGVVYGVEDSDIGRVVAVKTFKKTPAETKLPCSKEVRLTGGIDHPGVPSIYDVGRDPQGRFYFTMSLLEGDTLKDLIQRLREGDEATHGVFSFSCRVGLIIQVLRVLAKAHGQGVVHRDLKPANLLIGVNREVTVMDWGIALDINDSDGEGSLCGTPAYMAPEQSTLGAVDGRSDLYAVGAILYELLGLKRAAPSYHDVFELLVNVKSFVPEPIYTLTHPAQTMVPAEYVHVVMRAMEKDPRDRYQTAEEMIEALEQARTGYFEGLCETTQLKKRLNNLSRWIDVNPPERLSRLRVYLALSVGGIFAIGGAVGALIAATI